MFNVYLLFLFAFLNFDIRFLKIKLKFCLHVNSVNPASSINFANSVNSVNSYTWCLYIELLSDCMSTSFWYSFLGVRKISRPKTVLPFAFCLLSTCFEDLVNTISGFEPETQAYLWFWLWHPGLWCCERVRLKWF